MIFLFGFDLCFRFNTRNLWHYLYVHEISSGLLCVPYFVVVIARPLTPFCFLASCLWSCIIWDDKQHKCANRKCQQIKLKYIFLNSKTILQTTAHPENKKKIQMQHNNNKKCHFLIRFICNSGLPANDTVSVQLLIFAVSFFARSILFESIFIAKVHLQFAIGVCQNVRRATQTKHFAIVISVWISQLSEMKMCKQIAPSNNNSTRKKHTHANTYREIIKIVNGLGL